MKELYNPFLDHKKPVQLAEEHKKAVKTKPPKPATESEDKIQSDCFMWFYNAYPVLRGLLFHIPNGGQRSAREANKFKAMGVIAGIPDLFLSIPSRNKNGLNTGLYYGLYIEMKTPTGVLSKEQKEIHIKLIAQGYHVTVCRSLEEFKSLILNYLQDSIINI